MMKKIFALAAFLVAALPVLAQQVKYSVKGTSSRNGEKVYLSHNGMRNIRIDSTVVTDGRFAFEGEQPKDVILSVGRAEGSRSVLFFNDGTPVTIDLEENTLKGSALNERLTACDLSTISVNDAMETLNDELRAIQSDPSLTPEQKEKKTMEELMPKAQKVIEEMRVVYKRIFDENRDNIIPAAFIQNIIASCSEDQLAEMLDSKYPFTHHPDAAPIVKQLEAQLSITKARTAMIGKQFIDLEEADVDGRPHK